MPVCLRALLRSKPDYCIQVRDSEFNMDECTSCAHVRLSHTAADGFLALQQSICGLLAPTWQTEVHSVLRRALDDIGAASFHKWK